MREIIQTLLDALALAMFQPRRRQIERDVDVLGDRAKRVSHRH